jgi:hypothetical protein
MSAFVQVSVLGLEELLKGGRCRTFAMVGRRRSGHFRTYKNRYHFDRVHSVDSRLLDWRTPKWLYTVISLRT